eukprot:359517-Chlamydomonas_euryale.AAC.28
MPPSIAQRVVARSMVAMQHWAEHFLLREKRVDMGNAREIDFNTFSQAWSVRGGIHTAGSSLKTLNMQGENHCSTSSPAPRHTAHVQALPRSKRVQTKGAVCVSHTCLHMVWEFQGILGKPLPLLRSSRPRPVGADAGIVGADAGVVGADVGTVGVDVGTVGVDVGTVSVDDGLVGIDARPVGADARPVGATHNGRIILLRLTLQDSPHSKTLGLFRVVWTFQGCASPEEVLRDYGVEWDRVLCTTLGTANMRLYELRFQTAAATYQKSLPAIERVATSFGVSEVDPSVNAPQLPSSLRAL